MTWATDVTSEDGTEHLTATLPDVGELVVTMTPERGLRIVWQGAVLSGFEAWSSA